MASKSHNLPDGIGFTDFMKSKGVKLIDFVEDFAYEPTSCEEPVKK